jgi:hypothetical protein
MSAKVYKVRSCITFSPGWRHPIAHYRLRHLRYDLRQMDRDAEERRAAGDPLQAIMDKIARKEDDAFLNGA